MPRTRTIFALSAGLGVLLAVSPAPAETIVVNSTGNGNDVDSEDGVCANHLGQCTLEAAIGVANQTPGHDTIAFAVNGGGPQIIDINHAVIHPGLIIHESVTIDGTTQPGYAGDPLIELDGAGSMGLGILSIQADNCVIRGLIIYGGCNAGLEVFGADNTVIEHCWIGIDGSGTDNDSCPISIAGMIGIWLNGATNSRIGGLQPEQRNVLAGNNITGISITGGGQNQVIGNYFGVDPSGTTAIPNEGTNIFLCDSVLNVIGGPAISSSSTCSGACNVIAASVPYPAEGHPYGSGVWIEGGFDGPGTSFSSHNRVEGNFIGTDRTGSQGLGNQANGVFIRGSHDDTVGGASQDHRNIISANLANGIEIDEFNGNPIYNMTIQNNFIGTDETGTMNLGNTEHGVLIKNATVTTVGDTIAALTVQALDMNEQGNSRAEAASANDPPIAGDSIPMPMLQRTASTRAYPSVMTTLREMMKKGHRGLRLVTVKPFGTAYSEIHRESVNSMMDFALAAVDAHDGVPHGTAAPYEVKDLRSPRPHISDGGSDGDNGDQPSTTEDMAATDASYNSDPPGDLGNLIAFNEKAGVAVKVGEGNSIIGNVIRANRLLGIDLNEDGLTRNDDGDADAGANQLQNFPKLTSVRRIGNQRIIRGSLNSLPNKAFIIDFFAATTCNSTPDGLPGQTDRDHGEGEIPLGNMMVNTDVQGQVVFEFTTNTTIPDNAVFTATATDDQHNTSEFSRCLGPVVVPVEGGVRVRVEIPPGSGDPLPSVSIVPDGGSPIAARDIAVSTDGTKVYFTPPPFSGFQQGEGFVDVQVDNGSGSPITLTAYIEYTYDVVRGLSAVRQGLEVYCKEVMDNYGPAVFPARAPQGGAIADVILQGLFRRADPGDPDQRAELTAEIESFLHELRAFINAERPEGFTLAAVVRPITYGQTLSNGFRYDPDETVIFTLGTGSLTVRSIDEGTVGPATGGRLILPSDSFATESFVTPGGWSFEVQLDNDNGVQILDLVATDSDGEQEPVARRLSIPTIVATVNGVDQYYNLTADNLSHIYINDNAPTTGHAPGERTAAHDGALAQWMLTAVYRLNLDRSGHQNNEEKPAIVVRQSYGFSDPLTEFEPTHCLQSVQAYPRASFWYSDAGGQAPGPSVSWIRMDHRIAPNPQDTTPFIEGDAENEYVIGAFKDLDEISWWLTPAAGLGCQPVPLWSNIFDCDGTDAPITNERLFGSERHDNIHVHHVHTGWDCLWCGGENPIVEAPGSFNGTLHFHWRWGRDYGEDFGAGQFLFPQGQRWQMAVANYDFPVDPQPDFVAEMLGRSGNILKSEKVILVGCEQDNTEAHKQYESLSSGLTYSIGAAGGLVCPIPKAVVEWGGYHILRLGFCNAFEHWADTYLLMLESLGYQSFVCEIFTPGDPRAGGATLCENLQFQQDLLGQTTPFVETVGGRNATITTSPGTMMAGANMFTLAVGHVVAENLGEPGNTLTINFDLPVREIRHLPVLINAPGNMATASIGVFDGATSLGVVPVTATPGLLPPFLEGFANIDVDQPFDRITIISDNPTYEFAINGFQVCDEVIQTGDLDFDGDVDDQDYQFLLRCFLGPGRVIGYACTDADLDGDGDVDCDDVNAFQTIHSVGPCEDGDINCDGRVDGADWRRLRWALAGPGTLSPCGAFDLDGDNDVDLRDFADWEQLFDGVPLIVGACCQVDGTCTVNAEAPCTAAGGTYQGDETDCAGTVCTSLLGACCAEGGACSTSTEEQCNAESGDFHGLGTDCATETCPYTGYENVKDLSSFTFLNFNAAGSMRLADDVSLAGMAGACHVTRYELSVWGGGGGSFDVTASLYDGCPGEGGSPVPGTSRTWNGVPDNGQAQFLAEDVNSVSVASQLWLVAEFSTPESGWIVAEEAETGFTEDRFGLDLSPWQCNVSFGGVPYAGFYATIECE